MLNQHASNILTTASTQQSYELYNEFYEEYRLPISLAWEADTEKYNKILGYTLISKIAEGGFGLVYLAEDKEGRLCALKLLRKDIHDKPEMLQSFRRGVRSMRFLSKHNVAGIAQIYDAAEIPAIVVMEYIPGMNLLEAKERGILQAWEDIIEVGIQISEILIRAVNIPERVLHRDIRPQNIMIKDAYKAGDVINCVVLDFDLSFHKDAQEKSITTASINGYVAPEQVILRECEPTRSSLVDSFGLGMTLYFLGTGIQPVHLMHKHRTWREDLYIEMERHNCALWTSLPRRFARLVFRCTQDKQSRRPDMNLICRELREMRQTLRSHDRAGLSAIVIAEELASRTRIALGTGFDYEWSDDERVVKIKLLSGVTLSIIPKSEDGGWISVEVTWSKRENVDHNNVHKYLKERLDQSIAIAKKGGWRIKDSPTFSVTDLSFGFDGKAENVLSDLPRRVKAIADIALALNLS